jgi:hypothetical protein
VNIGRALLGPPEEAMEMTTIHEKPVEDPGASTRSGDVELGPPDVLPPLAPPWPPMLPGSPAPPVTVGPPAPVPTPPPQVHGSLTRIAFWTMLVALGLLAVVDASGVAVAASAYIAVALAVVGGALVVGFLYGRARALIAVGAVLVVALAIAAGVEHVGTGGQDVTWKPTTVAQLNGSYEINIGTAMLDLSAVDFTGRSVSITVHVAMGDLTVVLPSTVDARTVAQVSVGDAEVLGQEWSGIGQSEHVVTDLGPDGVGGGELTLHATVDVGNLEVRR